MENLFQATNSFAVPTVYHSGKGLSPPRAQNAPSFSLPHRLVVLCLAFDKAQDFIVYGFFAYPAKMDAHPVGGGADPFCKYSCFTWLFCLPYHFPHRIGSLRSFNFVA